MKNKYILLIGFFMLCMTFLGVVNAENRVIWINENRQSITFEPGKGQTNRTVCILCDEYDSLPSNYALTLPTKNDYPNVENELEGWMKDDFLINDPTLIFEVSESRVVQQPIYIMENGTQIQTGINIIHYFTANNPLITSPLSTLSARWLLSEPIIKIADADQTVALTVRPSVGDIRKINAEIVSVNLLNMVNVDNYKVYQIDAMDADDKSVNLKETTTLEIKNPFEHNENLIVEVRRIDNDGETILPCTLATHSDNTEWISLKVDKLGKFAIVLKYENSQNNTINAGLAYLFVSENSKVTNIMVEEVEKELANISGNYKVYKITAYDSTGKEIELAEENTLHINCPEGFNHEITELYKINGNNVEKLESITFAQDNEWGAQVSVQELGYFVVAEMEDNSVLPSINEIPTEPASNASETVENPDTGVFVFTVLISMATLMVIVFAIRKIVKTRLFKI